MAEHDETVGEETIEDQGFQEFFNDLPESGATAPVEEEPKQSDEEEVAEEEEEVQDEGALEEESDDTTEVPEEEEIASGVDEEEEEDEDDLDLDEDPEPQPQGNQALLDRIDKLEKLLTAKAEGPPKEDPPPTLPEDLEAKIFGDIDFDDAMADKGLFMKVIANALQVGSDVTRENVLKTIPNLVTQQTRGYYELVKMNKKFYKQNSDLRGFKETVAKAANEVHSEHPEYAMEKIMAEAAVRARRVLGIKKGAKPTAQPAKKPKQSPAFANTPKKAKKPVKLTGMQKDINDTLDL